MKISRLSKERIKKPSEEPKHLFASWKSLITSFRKIYCVWYRSDSIAKKECLWTSLDFSKRDQHRWKRHLNPVCSFNAFNMCRYNTCTWYSISFHRETFRLSFLLSLSLFFTVSLSTLHTPRSVTLLSGPLSNLSRYTCTCTTPMVSSTWTLTFTFPFYSEALRSCYFSAWLFSSETQNNEFGNFRKQINII